MIQINRKEEDKLVLEYQKTKSEDTLTTIIQQRLPTLSYLAHKNANNALINLHGSIEDIQSELIKVLISAINGFKDDKKSFNTFLLTCCINFFKNSNISCYQHKRANNGVFSLNTNCDDKDGASQFIDLLESKYNDAKIITNSDKSILTIAKLLNDTDYLKIYDIKTINDYLHAVLNKELGGKYQTIYQQLYKMRKIMTAKQLNKIREDIEEAIF